MRAVNDKHEVTQVANDYINGVKSHKNDEQMVDTSHSIFIKILDRC